MTTRRIDEIERRKEAETHIFAPTVTISVQAFCRDAPTLSVEPEFAKLALSLLLSITYLPKDETTSPYRVNPSWYCFWLATPAAHRLPNPPIPSLVNIINAAVAITSARSFADSYGV